MTETLTAAPKLHGSKNLIWAASILVVAAALVTVLIWQPWYGPVDPHKALDESLAALDNLKSYRVSFYQTASYPISEFTAEVVSPDNVYALIAPAYYPREYVSTGGKRYFRSESLTDAATQIADTIDWQIRPFGHDASQWTTVWAAEMFTSFSRLPSEEIEGIRCVHYRGKIDMDKYADRLAASIDAPEGATAQKLLDTLRKSEDTVDVWVNRQAGLFRIKWTYPTGATTCTLYDFDRDDIAVKAPLDEQGKLLPGWTALE